MASGSFVSNTGTNLNLYIKWSSTTNVSANTSEVTANVYIRSYTISGKALTDSYITINGNKKSFAGASLSKTSSELTDTLITTHKVTVAHNSDGKKSITIKANLDFNGTVSAVYINDITVSKTVDLDNIPRTSSFSIPSSVNVYSKLTVSITPSSSSYRHKVKFVVDGQSKYTSGYIAAGTKSFSYLIPRSWVSGTTDKKLTVYLYTYPSSGSTAIGSVSKTTTINVPYSTLSVPTSANTGSNLTVNIGLSNSGTSYRHRVKYVINGVDKYTTALGDIAAGSTSYAYTIPHTWLTTAESATMTIYLYTYNSSYNDDYIARVSKTLTLKVPSNIVPEVISVTPTIVDGLNGKYVKGKSKVTLTVKAKTAEGSPLSSYIYRGANINGNASLYTGTGATKTSSVITASGTQKYTVQVKDKRERTSSTKSTSIVVYEYSEPQITSITAKRCLEDGTLNNDGTYAKVTIKTTHASIGGANKAIVKLSNNKDSTSTQVISSTNGENTYTGIYGSNFDIQSSYTITATIVDAYGTHTKSTTLVAAQRILNIARHGNGLAIGKLSEVYKSTDTPKFECNWDATFLDDVRIKHSSSRCFEWIRTGISDDINNDGTNESADIQGQLYVANNGGVTCRRRYSTDNGESYTAQGYWQLRNEDMYISDPLMVSGPITTNERFGFNGSYSDHNFNIYGQWADGANHDILVRGTDGLSMGLGWAGGDNYETSLDIRPKKVSIRGETTVRGFRVPEIQHGNTSITPSAANTPTSKIITFKQEFSGSPDIIATPHTSVPGTIVLGVGTASRSTTGCTLWVTRANTTDTTINWIAIY